ncbi:hypothetical protein G4G28_21320 [Massilia sp. Dwa41.01b]|nr:hypothetical protein G4G28_21320 [Massilia sp. Dwa41.01b]
MTAAGEHLAVEAEADAEAVIEADTEADTDFTESDLAVVEAGTTGVQSEAEAGVDAEAAVDASDAVDAAAAPEHIAQDAEPVGEHEASNVIALPTATRPVPAPEDGIRRVGTLEIPLGLYNIYVAETDELLRVLERDFSEWRHEPGRAVTEDALKAAHTLAGTSSTVGFVDLRDLAEAIETTLEQLGAPAPTLSATQHDVLEAALESVRGMLQAFSRDELVPAGTRCWSSSPSCATS